MPKKNQRMLILLNSYTYLTCYLDNIQDFAMWTSIIEGLKTARCISYGCTRIHLPRIYVVLGNNTENKIGSNEMAENRD